MRELRNVFEQAVLLAAGPTLELEPASLSPVTGALETTQWNVSRAARLLGVSRDTMRYRMEKFRLAPPR